MHLHNEWLHFLEEAAMETNTCTVERSVSRMPTDEEIQYMNRKLHEYGYAVHCYRCQTCEEYSDGVFPFHLERILLHYSPI